MSRYNASQFANGTVADATAVDNELAKIAAVLNGGIDLTNITTGALDNSVFSAPFDPIQRFRDWAQPFVVTGLTIATSASLSTTIIGGTYYCNGKRVVVANLPITVVASKDTYIDLKDDGSVVQVAVSNGAASGMTLTLNSDGSNSLRIGKLVSSGSAITSSTQSGVDPINNQIYPLSPILGHNGWLSFTPTVTLNGGGSNSNAVISGGYQQIGKIVDFWMKYVVGSTTSFSGMTSMSFTLPVTMDSNFEAANANTLIGGGSGIHSSTYFALFPFLIDTTHVEPVGVVAGAAGQVTTVSATTPLTWGNGDTISMRGTYQAA